MSAAPLSRNVGTEGRLLYCDLVMILLAMLLACHADAQYLTTPEIQSESRCYASPDNPAYANAPVGGFPGNTFGASLFTGTIQSANIRLTCLEVFFERSSSMNASQAQSCLNYGWQLYVCTVNAATGVELCNNTANNAFVSNVSARSTWTAVDLSFVVSSPVSLRIRWLPNSTMPFSCYPMYFTTVAASLDNTPKSPSSLATVIIFVVIAGVVLLILAFFGRYQLRKVLSKFSKKVATKPRRSGIDGIDSDVPQARAGDYYDGQGIDVKEAPVEITDEEFRSQYGVHAIRTQGPQQAELVDGVRITARPLIQPWYERNSFISPDAKRRHGADHRYPPTAAGAVGGAAPVAMQVAQIMAPDAGGASSVRRRQPSPQFSIDAGSGVPSHRQPPLYMDPSINASMQYSNPQHASALYDEDPTLTEEPRRLQFASPVQRGGAEPEAFSGANYQNVARFPPTRTLNPYED